MNNDQITWLIKLPKVQHFPKGIWQETPLFSWLFRDNIYTTSCSGPSQTKDLWHGNTNLLTIYLFIYLQRYDLMVWKKIKIRAKEPGISVWYWNFTAVHIWSPTTLVFSSVRQDQYKTARTLLYVCILWDPPNATSENSWDNIFNGKHCKGVKNRRFPSFALMPSVFY